MKTIILILIIAIGLGVSLRARRERRASENEMESIAKEYAESLQNVTNERHRLQIARDARAAVQVASRTEAAETAPSKPRKLSAEAALANNPALLAESLQCRRDVADWWSDNMFRVVGFSPRQIEQWKQMAVEDEQHRLDLIAAVEAQGLSRNSETFKTLTAENEKLRRAREAEILGDLEPKYREYQRQEGTRGMVEWLTRTGVYQNEPITGAQVERATQILAANTRQTLRRGNGEEIPIIDWVTATGQLKDALSPAQIATLQRLGRQFEEIGKAAQRVDERTKLLTAQFKGETKR